jgi:hypothetical protein
MSADTILAHQLASCILFVYGCLAVAFTKRPRRKPPQSVRPKGVSNV